MKSESVTAKATGSMKWSILSEIVSRAATPLTFVILARILTPKDFGVVAIAQIAISFCTLFWDAGLEKALIQTREPLEKAANVVFWINVVLGVLIYSALYAIAPSLAIFFDSPSSGSVLQVLGLQIIIGSFTTVQQALFLRDFNFKQIFWAKLATAAIPALVSIPLAIAGYGVWALVASSLVAATSNLLILWIRSPWRPSCKFDVAIAQKMANFGAWIVLDSFIGWFIAQGDAVVVGRYLGVRDLGFYRTGRNIIDILFSLTLNPISPVLYPAFSALNNDKEALRSFLYATNRIIMFLALPVGAGMMCIATPFVAVVLGEKWQGVEIVLSLIGLQTALGWLVAANPEIYRAVGRPDLQTKIALINFPLFLLVYLVAAPYGLTAFVVARFALAIVSLPIQIWAAVKILNVPYAYLWKTGKPMILSTIIMVLVISGLKSGIGMGNIMWPAIVELVTCIIAGIVSYIGALMVLDKSFVLQTRDMVKNAFFV